jgi:hypothetical protein
MPGDDHVSGAEKVERWFTEGRLVRPVAEEPSFVDLVCALAELAGVAGAPRTGNSPRLAEAIGPADHLVFVLVDGMGDELLSAAAAEGFLRARRVQRLRAVFPSTTAAALTTLATARWPGEHAAWGWWLYLPDRELSVTALPFVERFSGQPLEQMGLRAEDVFPVPSIWPTARLKPLTVLKEGLEDSTFSRYAAGETARVGAKGIAEALDGAAERVEAADGPTFTYVYLPQLDALCHDKGTAAAEELLGKLDGLLASLSDRLAGRARLVVSADHGLLDIPPERQFVIAAGEELMETLVSPPSGEPRVPAFHIRGGQEERFGELLAGRCGDAFALITPDEAEELELFGPGKLNDALRPRLGTFLGIAPGPATLYFRPAGGDVFVHAAVHAGLSPREMRIPFIVA